jgi:DNA-binding transcriptional ArsR family regulator
VFRLSSIKRKVLPISLAISLIFTSIAIVKIVEEITLPPETKLGALVLEKMSSQDSFFEWTYKNSPYFAASAWIGFAIALMWKGSVRTLWKKYGYDMFRLLVKMRGGTTRVKILQSLSAPKTRLQLARELGLDWKAISRHINVLMKNNLVKEMFKFYNGKYFMITDQGKELLELLNRSKYSA